MEVKGLSVYRGDQLVLECGPRQDEAAAVSNLDTSCIIGMAQDGSGQGRDSCDLNVVQCMILRLAKVDHLVLGLKGLILG